MNNQEFSWNGFSKVPIVGIIRNLSFDTIEKILPIGILILKYQEKNFWINSKVLSTVLSLFRVVVEF